MKRLACLLLVLALMACGLSALAEADAQEVAVDAALDAEAVKELQIDLIAGGYLQGEADGLMGADTQNAIRAAQQALGLTVNGLMTDELCAALRKDAFPLKLETRSSYVYEMQKRLSLWGFLEEAPTGYFGEATRDAVISFQSFAAGDYAAKLQAASDAEFAQLSLPSDVAVDQPLYTAASVASDGVMTREWYAFLIEDYKLPIVTATLDDAGEGVKLVQRRLHALGYLYGGADGTFSEGTVLALKYFQRKSGLPESGSCDEATSAALFSETAPKSEEYVMPYMARVDRKKSRVYIYGWDGAGYNVEAKAFKCSCGAKATPTLEGTFYCEGPISEWYYMAKSVVWVRYAFKIQGNYFFHSVLFKHKGNKYPTSTSVKNLGKNVSHGCIRLAVEDARWIYENCTKGMKVVIE